MIDPFLVVCFDLSENLNGVFLGLTVDQLVIGRAKENQVLISIAHLSAQLWIGANPLIGEVADMRHLPDYGEWVEIALFDQRTLTNGATASGTAPQDF